MKIEKMERVALAVRDLDKASPFFEELLGIRFDPIIDGSDLGMTARYSADGLELVAGTENSAIDKFIESRGEGVFCVVFKVSDMTAALAHFVGKGLKPVNDVTFGGLREVAFHPRDSFGLQIVLSEYDSIHPATHAVMSS